MARIKTKNIDVDETTEVVETQSKIEVAETTENLKPDIENGIIDIETNAAPPLTETVNAEIPDAVKNILKVFANEAKLYVNAKTGGVFSADTKPSTIGDAILYQNPFYNSK